MTNYLLDSCVLIKLVAFDPIQQHILDLINSKDSKLFVSSISVHELIHYIKKHSDTEERNFRVAKEVFTALKIKVLYVNAKALEQYATLKLFHNDPADHVIISQAIANNLTAISCDTRFSDYEPTLKLVYFKNIKPK